MEEARKVVMSEMQGNYAALSGEVIMESVGISEEEVMLNNPLNAPFIIHSSSSSPPFFTQVSNTAADEAKENVSGEGQGMEEARKVVMLEKEGNPSAFYVEVIMESVGSPEEEVKLNTPVLAPHLNICKIPTSLEETQNMATVRCVASDNASSECNNNIVTETKDSDNISVKPSSPSGMLCLMRMLFLFDVEYIY